MSNPGERVFEAAVVRGKPFMSLTELGRIWDAVGDLRDGDTWGGWCYHAGVNVLRHDAHDYEVYLGDPAAGDFTWIAHLADKAWLSNVDLGAFVRALQDVRRGK